MTMLPVLSLVVASLTLTADPELVVASEVVRIGDVLADEPSSPGIADLSVLRLPAGHRSIELHRDQLADLIRRRAPGLRINPNGTGKLRLTLASAGSIGGNAQCTETTGAIEAGSPVWREDVRRVPCAPERPRSPIRFVGEHGEVVTATALPAGSYLGPALPPSRPAITRGEPLVVRAHVGPVIVERSVSAVQNIRGAARLFVRAEDGAVFAVPVRAKESRP